MIPASVIRGGGGGVLSVVGGGGVSFHSSSVGSKGGGSGFQSGGGAMRTSFEEGKASNHFFCFSVSKAQVLTHDVVNLTSFE